MPAANPDDKSRLIRECFSFDRDLDNLFVEAGRQAHVIWRLDGSFGGLRAVSTEIVNPPGGGTEGIWAEPLRLALLKADLVLVPRRDLARVQFNGDRVREADRHKLAAGDAFALFEDHPVAHAIPRGPFRELSLWGMATDTALAWIAAEGPVKAVRPIVTRVDAREFLGQHYLVELAYGEGTLIVGTLRIEGGMGKQPGGLAANSAALFLVDRVLRRLAACEPG